MEGWLHLRGWPPSVGAEIVVEGDVLLEDHDEVLDRRRLMACCAPDLRPGSRRASRPNQDRDCDGSHRPDCEPGTPLRAKTTKHPHESSFRLRRPQPPRQTLRARRQFRTARMTHPSPRRASDDPVKIAALSPAPPSDSAIAFGAGDRVVAHPAIQRRMLRFSD